MLEFRGVWKSYNEPGRWVLRGIDLQVAAGECLVVMGGNGAGKSTLTRLLASDRPTRGAVYLDGRSLTALPDHQRTTCVCRMTQAPEENLSDALSIEEHFALALAKGRRRRWWRGVTSSVKATAERIVRDLHADLASRLGAGVHQFSGGERQLLALGLVIAGAPRVLVLDEPTSALDLANRDKVQSAALQVIKKTGLTALWITHDPDEALLVGSRVVILAGGGVVRDLGRAELDALGPAGLSRHLMETMFRPGAPPGASSPQVFADVGVA